MDQWEHESVKVYDGQDRAEVLKPWGDEGWEEVGSGPLYEPRIVPQSQSKNATRPPFYVPNRKQVRVGELVHVKRRKPQDSPRIRA